MDGEGASYEESGGIAALLARPSEVRTEDTSSIMNMQRSNGSLLERKM